MKRLKSTRRRFFESLVPPTYLPLSPSSARASLGVGPSPTDFRLSRALSHAPRNAQDSSTVRQSRTTQPLDPPTLTLVCLPWCVCGDVELEASLGRSGAHLEIVLELGARPLRGFSHDAVVFISQGTLGLEKWKGKFVLRVPPAEELLTLLFPVGPEEKGGGEWRAEGEEKNRRKKKRTGGTKEGEEGGEEEKEEKTSEEQI